VIAVALALGASALWGVGDFLGGITSRRLAAVTVVALSQVVGLAAVLAVAAVAGGSFLSAEGVAAACAAGLAGAIGLGALFRGMAIGAIGVVAPISASAAVLPVAVGLARGERPEAIQLVGIALALIGVFLVAREPEAVRGLATGVPLALLAALGFGSFFVFVDRASQDDVLWAIVVARVTSSTFALAFAFARGKLHVPRDALPALVAIGVFDTAANVLLAFALNEGFVSLVSVVASLYPVVTVLLAIAVLHERPSRPQAVGGAAALAGVALISAAA
jgi:drug/metabolite transporter (DMT)-like permease